MNMLRYQIVFLNNLISVHGHFRSPPATGNVEMGARQVTSEFSSTMAGFLAEKDMNLMGKNLMIVRFGYVSPVKC